MDDNVLGPFDIVFFDIGLDEVDKRLSVFLCFGDTYTHTATELLDGAGILDGHVVDGTVLEDDVQRELFVACYVAQKAFELSVECLVAHSGTSCRCRTSVLVGGLAVVVVAGYHDVVGFLDETVSRRGEFEHTEHLNLFGEKLLE